MHSARPAHTPAGETVIFRSNDKSGAKEQRRRQEKNEQWLKLVQILTERFNKEKANRETAGYYFLLSIRAPADVPIVSLTIGKNPSGTDYNNPRRFIVEHGASIVVSRGDDGSVAVFLHPCHSERSLPEETSITWAIYDFPKQFTARRIEAAIGDFFRYVDVTSDLRTPSRWARFQIDWLRQKQKLSDASSKHPKIWILSKITAGLLAIYAFVGTASGLAGVTVPQLLDMISPDKSEAVLAMPVISGRYTFCPNDKNRDITSDSKLFNFLYDIRQNDKKIAFFDVRLDIDCTLIEEEPNNDPPWFSRQTEGNTVTYSFHFPYIDVKDKKAVADVLNGGREIQKLNDMYADNGSHVTFDGTTTKQNLHSQLVLNREGLEDSIYGPYQIKSYVDDAAAFLELTAPSLDSSAAKAADFIDSERIKIRQAEKSMVRETPNRPISIPTTNPETTRKELPIPNIPKQSFARESEISRPLPTIPVIPAGTPVPLPPLPTPKHLAEPAKSGDVIREKKMEERNDAARRN